MASRVTRPAERYHHGNLREALLSAAVLVLSETGPEGLSIREVARRASVSHGAPYNHFPTKRDLLVALGQRAFLELDREMAEAQACASSTAGEQLVATGIGYLLFAERNPTLFSLMFRSDLFAPEAVVPPQDGHANPAGGNNDGPAYRRLRRAVLEVCREAGRSSTDAGVELDCLFAWSCVHGLARLSIEGVFRRMPLEARLSQARQILTRTLSGIPRASEP
jgi:AcrR family transcriptional regulator